MKRLAGAARAVFHADPGGQLLVGPQQLRLVEDPLHHLLLQRVAEHRALVSHRALAEAVLGDGGILSEKRVVVVRQRRGRIEQQHFRPIAHLVAGAGLERVALERQGLRQVGELLVMEAGGLAQRSRSHHRANRRVLVAEAAFQRQHQVPARARVVHQPREQRVARDVQWRNHHYLVPAQVRGFGKNEIHAHIQPVERPVQPMHLHVVTPRMTPGHVARRLPSQKRHVLGAAARIVAVEQGHRVGCL